MSAPYASQRPDQHNERVTGWPRAPLAAAVRNDESLGKKRSLGRRTMRAVARFLIAILVGVGATLAWQSYGNEAKEMVKAWAPPSLAWLLPTSTESPRAAQGSIAGVITSAELMQQLQSVALELANVQQRVEQLATTTGQLVAKQERMAQDIATLPAIEQDIRERLSAQPKPRTVAPRKTRQSIQPTTLSPQPSTSGPPLR